ncbi:hypothetical protein KCP74_10595 [Salmonella enterica subsp. enterica]|nr:hypothetical protein KCP74_10595 [Salmonella enterica subsp. enterica]
MPISLPVPLGQHSISANVRFNGSQHCNQLHYSGHSQNGDNWQLHVAGLNSAIGRRLVIVSSGALTTSTRARIMKKTVPLLRKCCAAA